MMAETRCGFCGQTPAEAEAYWPDGCPASEATGHDFPSETGATMEQAKGLTLYVSSSKKFGTSAAAGGLSEHVEQVTVVGIKDQRYPIPSDGEGVTTMTKVEALTKVLAASDALHAHDDEWGTDAAIDAQATYDAVMAECDPVLGPDAMDRLASICTGERWSPEDMLRASQDPAEVERMLARITAPEPE